jgi:DNA-binding MarR family transcriptional regulator
MKEVVMGEHDATDEAAASHLARQILSSARELERRFDSWLSKHKLNLTRADVLACLAAHGESGCSQTDLASSLQLSESNVCTLIERMRTDGWLFRLRSDVDRRRSVIVVSPQGMQALGQIDQMRRHVRQWLGELSVSEVDQLNTLLDRLLQALRCDSERDAASDSPASIPLEPLRRAS